MARSDGYNTKTRQLILDYLINNRQHAVSASNILEHLDEVRAHLMAEHGFTLQCEGSVLYGLCRHCAQKEEQSDSDGQTAQKCACCVDTDKKP